MISLAVLIAAALASAPTPQQPAAPADDGARLLEQFQRSTDLAEREALATRIAESGIDFDTVYAALRRGRPYDADVERGRLVRSRVDAAGTRFPYVVLVPKDYTPERRYPVRLDLHGGMGAPEWDAESGAWNPGWTYAEDQIVILPAGWIDAMWWERCQAENLDAILADVGAEWNVNENAVVAVGTSDGGAALYFLAMRTPDRYAGYAGFVGPPDRLTRADFRPDGQLHLSNLAGQRLHLNFGGRDRLVPLKHVERYLEVFEAHGAQLDVLVLPDQGHALTLPDERMRTYANFLWNTRRDPLPERLSWATESTERYARRSWLVIDELEPTAEDHEVDESNLLPRYGTTIQLRGPTVPRVPWGRVEVERDGNLVNVTTRRVKRFRLLIAPNEFDLAQPIRVVVDGEHAIERTVEPSVATLLRWAAHDDDRSVLFAAELAVEL